MIKPGKKKSLISLKFSKISMKLYDFLKLIYNINIGRVEEEDAAEIERSQVPTRWF